MNKIIPLLLLLGEAYSSITPVQPIVYYSDVCLTPLKEGEMTIPFSFHAPLAYSEAYTSFSCLLDGEMKDHFAMHPGTFFKKEFVFQIDDLEEGIHQLTFKAESSQFTVSKLIEIETPKKESYVIDEILDNSKILSVDNAFIGLDDKGITTRQKENFEFLFEPFILSSSCFKLDFSSIKIKYQHDYDLSSSKVSLLLYGTMDDFPRLQFDDEKGGYEFNAKLIKNQDYYQFALDEKFYVDYDTYMISRAAGDYFYPTNELYVTKQRREEQKEYPFTITFEDMGYHKSKLIYNGRFIFLKDALGEEGTNSEIYLKEEENDSRLGDNWEIW